MKSLKAFLKQKTGMTFVEILVAMSVLMLVIVSFTPMLLHSYDSLYTAGEINEKTYDAKSTVEEGLATRSSTDIIYNIQTNFKNIGKVADVNLRRAVSATGSDLRDGIESLFYGGKGTLKIISGKRVNDDTIDKTILIKTSGIVIDKVVAGKASDAKMTKNGKEFKYTIAVSVIAPDWSKTSETEAYNLSAPLTNITCSFDKQGLITVKIPDKDLTSSPLKIIVYYFDETTKLNNTGTAPASGEAPREASTFFYIDPPTLLLAGKTESNGVYYTSAGIETANNGVSTMKVEKRNMTTAGNFSVPGLGTTVVRNVTWVDNDATGKYGNYYVLTGTNGAIMRLYPSLTATAFQEIQSNTATTTTKQPVSIKDSGLTKTVYPTLWGGDKTEQFGYSTFFKSMGYRWPSVKNSGTSCWYTQNGISGATADSYNLYGTQAKYAYYFNGWRTDYEYSQQNGRKISYILTEANSPLRVSGAMADKDSFTDYNALWESDTRYLSTRALFDDHNTTQKKAIKIYCASSVVSDKHLAYLNLKSFNNLGAGTDMLYSESKYGSDNGTSSRINYLSNDNATKTVTVTSAVYDEKMGGMFYTGTVDSYLYMNQLDNTSGTSSFANKVEANYIAKEPKNANGTFTAYYMLGTSNGSTIKKASEGSGSWGNCASLLKASTGAATTERTGDSLTSFYVNRSTSVAEALLKDVNITFGFSSNRAKVYYHVTVDNGNEQYKSYEKYYFLSHYGIPLSTYDNKPNEQAHYYSLESGGVGYNSGLRNNVNNDYYNVWFPGEFYNITHTVVKEGIVVGVGYAVVGSTFQWVNPSQTTNTSTALGSVYNDGVLAVKMSSEDTFNNKLYFKDNATFDSTSLSTLKSEYSSVFGTYGTHKRDSVQFTAVDIQVLATGDESRNVKSFYAIYGDNKGRVFKSLVATTYSTGSEADSSTSTVDFIADLSYAGSTTPPSRMEEITINGASLSTYFKSISTIVCDDTTVVISGVPKTGSAYGNSVVVGVAVLNADETTTTWRWGHVELASASYLTNVAKIVDGNYYAAGTYNTSKGFLLGIPLSTIKDAVQQGTVDLRSKVLVDNTHITTPVYGMDGRGANG